jgi:LysM repeat protein
MSITRLIQILSGIVIVSSIIVLILQINTSEQLMGNLEATVTTVSAEVQTTAPPTVPVTPGEPVVIVVTSTPTPTSSPTVQAPESSNNIYANLSLSLKTHTVVAGDNLYRLAQTYHTSVDALMQVNYLSSTTIYVGTVLLIPYSSITPTPDVVATRVEDVAATVEAVSITTEMNATTIAETAVAMAVTVEEIESTTEALVTVNTTTQTGAVENNNEKEPSLLEKLSPIAQLLAPGGILTLIVSTYVDLQTNRHAPGTASSREKEQTNLELLRLEVEQKKVDVEKSKRELEVFIRQHRGDIQR